MNDIYVQLGFNIDNYNYDDNTELLFISGPALESGVWSDSLGNTLFYPSHVIQEAAQLFKNCDLVCEHKGQPIGKVTDVSLSAKGFNIDGYVTNKDSIKSIINKHKLGFSIAANVSMNPLTLEVNKIYNIQHIALVESPACKICGISNAYTNKGNVAMSTKKVKEEVKVEEPVEVSSSEVEMASAEEPTIVEEVIVESPPAPVNNVSIKADAVVIEQVEKPLTEIMAALSAATNTVSAVSTQLDSAITRLQEMEVALSGAKSENANLQTELETVKVEASTYKAKCDELNAQLAKNEKVERESLVSEIMTIDPDTNAGVIESMSTVQLSAYSSSLKRFTKGMIGGERKGIMADEAVPNTTVPNTTVPNTTVPEQTTEVAMSEPVSEPKILSNKDTASLVCGYLQKQIMANRMH